MAEFYASIVVFLVACAIVLRVGLYLPGFFFLCYMLPFLPLVPAYFYDTAHFWTGDAFSYETNSLEVAAISAVWLASSLGCVSGFILRRVSLFPSIHTQRKQEFANSDSAIGKKLFRLWIVCFFISLLIVWRFSVGGDAGGDVIFGGEMIVCVLMLFVFLAMKHAKSVFLYIALLSLAFFYIYGQILYGDRDFFTIAVALILFYSANRYAGCIGMLKLAVVGVVIVGFGALISMLRMGVELSPEKFSAFFYYNSWTATIQPVLLMIQSEWSTGPTLFGKSYVDLLASVVPSVIYSLFDSQKPISVDNPALWFYVEGMGGMHAAGVAWRNFGVPGVFFQSLLMVWFLSKVERCVVRCKTFWSQFFYLVVASQLMHTVWYSLVSMVNALVLFVLVYVFFNVDKLCCVPLGRHSNKI